MRAMYSVVILAFSTFIVNMGASMMTPFLPVYAKSFGATLGIEIGLYIHVSFDQDFHELLFRQEV